MFSLENKKAVITGAASGIGKAIALLFAKQGAEVFILDFNEAAALDVVNEITASAGKASAHGCDVSNQSELVNIFKGIGPIDILINNAGIAHVGSLENTASEDFNRVFKVNVEGAYNTMFAAIPHLKANGGGSILNMASIAAHVGLVDRFAYSMSKGCHFCHDTKCCKRLSAPKYSL